MKYIKKIILMLMICIMTLAIPMSASAAVKICKKSVILIKGQTTTLKITGTKKTVKWSSNKASVATVTQNGKIKAKKKGSAVITAKIGSKKLKCKVSVESPKINKESVTLEKGDSYKLKISGTKQEVEWQSSKPGIVTVSENGKIIARKAGNATITALVNGKAYKCKVTVKSEEEETVSGAGYYILNTNSMKFHEPSCGSAKRIASYNYAESSESRDELIARGYDPCGNCEP